MRQDKSNCMYYGLIFISKTLKKQKNNHKRQLIKIDETKANWMVLLHSSNSNHRVIIHITNDTLNSIN